MAYAYQSLPRTNGEPCAVAGSPLPCACDADNTSNITRKEHSMQVKGSMSLTREFTDEGAKIAFDMDDEKVLITAVRLGEKVIQVEIPWADLKTMVDDMSTVRFIAHKADTKAQEDAQESTPFVTLVPEE